MCLKSYILRKTCGFAQIVQKKLRKTKILFHAQLSQKKFPVLHKLRKKKHKTHCVSCAKIAQKFAKDLAISWKPYSRFMSGSRYLLESEFLLTGCGIVSAFCGLANPLCSSSVTVNLLMFLPLLLSHLFRLLRIGSISPLTVYLLIFLF